MLRLLKKNSEKNSRPFFSNMVRVRAFNLFRPLIGTIKPYNFYCKHFWLRSFHSNISGVPLLLWEFTLTVRHCIAVSWLSSNMFFVFVLPGLASRKSITVRRRRLSWTRFWDTDTTNGLGPRGRTTQVIKKKVREKSYIREMDSMWFSKWAKSLTYTPYATRQKMKLWL